MFWRKKRQQPNIPFPLHFKSAEAAVEYSSAFMNCRIAPGVELPAVVLDAKELFDFPSAVRVNDDGIQLASIKVAGDNGGFLTFTQTSGKHGPALKPGDLVSWQAFQFLPELGQKASDRRTGWVGLITGVLTPTLVAAGWVGAERFRS